MTLVRNLLLFLVLFLPASCGTAMLAGFLDGPLSFPTPRYEVFRFLGLVVPLLLPSFLMVPVLHFAYRFWLGRRDAPSARRSAILVTPIALLGVHLAVFGGAFLSVPLLILFFLPGALYGACFGFVRRSPD